MTEKDLEDLSGDVILKQQQMLKVTATSLHTLKDNELHLFILNMVERPIE